MLRTGGAGVRMNASETGFHKSEGFREPVGRDRRLMGEQATNRLRDLFANRVMIPGIRTPSMTFLLPSRISEGNRTGRFAEQSANTLCAHPLRL